MKIGGKEMSLVPALHGSICGSFGMLLFAGAALVPADITTGSIGASSVETSSNTQHAESKSKEHQRPLLPAAHHVGPNAQHAESRGKEHQRLALHSDHSMSERARGARLSRVQSRTQLIQFNSSPSRVRTDWDGVRQRPHDQRSKPGIYRTSKVRLSLVRCFNPRPSPTV